MKDKLNQTLDLCGYELNLKEMEEVGLDLN